MNQTRLVLLSGAPDRPSPFLIIDPAGMVLRRGTLSAAAAATPGDMRTIVILPGVDVTARWVHAAGATPAQAAGAAAAGLEDDLAASREELHIVASGQDSEVGRLVCITSRDRMRAVMQHIAALGLTPETILPDYLILPEPAGETLIAADLGDSVAVRGRDIAFGAERDLVPLLAGNRPFERVSEPWRLDAMLAQTAERPAINLRQGEFAVRPESVFKPRDLRLAACLAMALLLSPLVLMGAEIARQNHAADQLIAQATANALSVTGAVQGNPVDVLVERAAQTGASERFFTSTAALVDATGRAGGRLQALTYADDGSMSASLIHGAYGDIDALRAAMEPAGFVVRENASTETDGLIQTDIMVAPAR